MTWNLEGLSVRAVYLDQFEVEGIVRLSRVKYGGGVSHHVDLLTPIIVYGAERHSVIIDHAAVQSVMESQKRVNNV